MEVERSSSRPLYPASVPRVLPPMSRSRDGRGPSETKLQHLAAFSDGRRALAVTSLTIHDNVMRVAIPATGLLQ
jgi:hypothetical protein